MTSSPPAEIIIDEKKKDSPLLEERIMSGPFLSPSKQRAKTAASAGLSELSKQLRIFQAKNEAQAVEINRLERQLRILAELQGISVADLRKALEDACANEAFGEMQHRVAKLRAELEAATLAKQKELRQDATAPHIANLELRVGELEEVEEKQQTEIHHLYEQLRHERARATRLESASEQYKKDSQDYLDRLKKEASRASRLELTFQEQVFKLEEQQATKLKQQLEQAQGESSSVVSVSPEMSADYERLLRTLKEKDEALRRAQEKLRIEQENSMQNQKEAEDQARQAQIGVKVDQDRMDLTIKEMQDVDSQNELRLAQYKARFAMQDERIEDMAQQLDSLYTAFELLKEDFRGEREKYAALKSNLDEADAEVARQTDDLEKHQGGGSANHQRSTTVSLGVPRTITAPSTPNTTQSTVARSSGTPYAVGTPVSDAYYSASSEYATPNSARRTPVSPTRTPTTWQLLQNRASPSWERRRSAFSQDVLVSGTLIVKSKSAFRKWKTKSSTLYLSGNHYQWNMGEGKSYTIGFRISKVEFYANHPLAFMVHLNPFDSDAPVIYAAAMNEQEYHRWIAALTKATTGEEYQVDDIEVMTPRRHSEAIPPSASFGMSSSESFGTGTSAEEREAADLARALELSKQHT